MGAESMGAGPARLFVEQLETPIGVLEIVADTAGRLCAVEWMDHRETLERSLRRQHGARGFALRSAAGPTAAGDALAAYFRGELGAIDGLSVAAGGTAFQRRVWQALRCIPCGETVSYAALARRIGRPTAMRAVGHANGANPVSVVVPCHRVVGTDGSLTGYGGGIERKRWLLAHERQFLRPDQGRV